MSKPRHPSGRPIHETKTKPAPRLPGHTTEPVVARLGVPTTWLASGAGFPINPSYDEFDFHTRKRR